MIADKPRSVETQSKLAMLLGVSERMVRNYIRDGMPGSPGYYDVEECRHWVANNIKSHGEAVDGNLKEKRLRAEIRKLNADADQKELRNEETLGNLLHREDVLQWISEAFLMVKTRLESIPDEIEMQLPPNVRAETKAEIANRIRLVLSEMAAFQLEGSQGESEEGDDYA